MSTRMRLMALTGLLCLSLGACATAPTRTVISTPPADLVQDCPEPASDFQTNADLVTGFLDMRQALRVCNADKAALRLWISEVSKENP